MYDHTSRQKMGKPNNLKVFGSKKSQGAPPGILTTRLGGFCTRHVSFGAHQFL
jgi:hypothetical protein